MRKILFAYSVFLLISSAHAATCSSDQFQKNIKTFTLDGQYQIYYDGALASCELSCFDKIECVVACQKRNAKRSLISQITSLYGSEIIKCAEVAQFITKI